MKSPGRFAVLTGAISRSLPLRTTQPIVLKKSSSGGKIKVPNLTEQPLIVTALSLSLSLSLSPEKNALALE